MYSHISLPPTMPNILIQKIMDLGRELDDYCPYWIDKDILENLPKILKERYLNQCHQPHIVFNKNSSVLEIKCCRCNMTYNVLSCNRSFPKIAERLQLDFENNLKEKKEGIYVMHKEIRKVEKAEKKVSKGLKKLEKKDIKLDKKMDKIKKKKMKKC